MDRQGESSSSQNNVNQKIGIKIIDEPTKGEGPENKKSKQKSEEETENAKESRDEINRTSVNDLPPEMLMKILKNVDSTNLIVSRLVNRKWKTLATEILDGRGEMEMIFKYDDDDGFFKQLVHGKLGIKSLEDFTTVFKYSEKCPTRFFFSFSLKPSSPSKFDNSDFMPFLIQFGQNIKCFKLHIKKYSIKHFIPFTEKLSDLLLNGLPNLEEFGLNFTSENRATSMVKLFPKSENILTNTETKRENTSTATTETTIITITKTVVLQPPQLPRLKILHLSEILFSICPAVVEDLLKAAFNLKRIEEQVSYDGFMRKGFKAEDYIFLHSCGKLDLLEEAFIIPSAALSSALKEHTSAFKLKKLQVGMKPIYKDPSVWADASTFISNLFESNKETLRELTMDPVGILPNVKIPRFSQLKSFSIEDNYIDLTLGPVFPPGINCLDVFPVLDTIELDVDWLANFPSEENIPRIPSVSTLKVLDWNMTEDVIAGMALMCPNLKNFTISHSCEDRADFSTVGPAIFTHMKQLQSLDMHADVDDDLNMFHTLDSCFTGISRDNCKRLYELMKAETYLKKWSSQAVIPQTELSTPERITPCILDLKHLKKLRVRLRWYVGESRESREDLLKRALTSVSETYAFKLMNNLDYKIEESVDYGG